MAEEEKTCLLTRYPVKKILYCPPYIEYHSPRAGGKYRITNSLVTPQQDWSTETEETIAKLCRWIYEQNSNKQKAEVTTGKINGLKAEPFPSSRERMDMYIKWLGKKLGNNLSKTIKLNDPESMAASCALDEADHAALLEYVKEKDWIKIDDVQVKLTPDGRDKYDKAIKGSQEQSEIIFVAMWFDDKKMEGFYEHIEKAIIDANLGYKLKRIGDYPFIGKIEDEIIAKISECHFVIADFTSEINTDKDRANKPKTDNVYARGNVYYETGFARGLGKTVIPTIRKGLIDYIHFDISHDHFIQWTKNNNGEFLVSRKDKKTLGEELVDLIKLVKD